MSENIEDVVEEPERSAFDSVLGQALFQERVAVDALIQMSVAAGSSSSVQARLGMLLKEGRRLFHAEHAVLVAGDLRVEEPQGDALSSTSPVRELAAQVLAAFPDLQPIHVDDLQLEPLLHARLAALLGEREVHSVLAAPLVGATGQGDGCICFLHAESDCFGPRARVLVEAVASLAALALEAAVARGELSASRR